MADSSSTRVTRRKESTSESYRRQVKRYMVPALGNVKLKKLSAMHGQGMYRSMLDRNLSPRTVQYTHAILHRALKQAVRWGLVPRNVCEDVDRPRLQREEMLPLCREQARRLLKVTEGDRLEALYASMYWPYTRGCVLASYSALSGRMWTSMPPAEASASTAPSPRVSLPRQSRRGAADG